MQNSRYRAFTLMETVIAIGVVAVILTGFIVVFGPAAQSIKTAINVQVADRFASTLEEQLVTIKDSQITPDIKSGFDKAFFQIKDSTGSKASGDDAGNPDKALLLYTYRGSTTSVTNGRPNPVTSLKGKISGEHYQLVTVLRERGADEVLITEEVGAVEGPIALVKAVQLVFDNNSLKPADSVNKSYRGEIRYLNGPTLSPANKPDDYPEAVIAFAAEFYLLPSKAGNYITGNGFENFYKSPGPPSFTRNIAVRR